MDSTIKAQFKILLTDLENAYLSCEIGWKKIWILFSDLNQCHFWILSKWLCLCALGSGNVHTATGIGCQSNHENEFCSIRALTNHVEIDLYLLIHNAIDQNLQNMEKPGKTKNKEEINCTIKKQD